MKASFKDIINGEVPVLVDFFATWCGPCKTMGPILDQVKQSLGTNVRIVKIDVDKNDQLAKQHRIQGVPTLVLYSKGKQLWRQSGVVPANQLVQLIQKHQA